MASKKQQSIECEHSFHIGDILVSTWGWDQTNVDWYQVTGVTAKSIKIRPIKGQFVETQFLAGYSMPRRNEFTGPEETKRVLAGYRDKEVVKVGYHQYARAWDGRKEYESRYA